MTRAIGLTLAIAFALAACGEDKKEGGGAAVQVSADMQAFLGSLSGSSSATKSALSKYGASGLATKDMEMYNLKEGKVTAKETRGAQECYTFDAKSGVTTRTYVTCWEGGKIALVEDKGLH